MLAARDPSSTAVVPTLIIIICIALFNKSNKVLYNKQHTFHNQSKEIIIIIIIEIKIIKFIDIIR